MKVIIALNVFFWAAHSSTQAGLFDVETKLTASDAIQEERFGEAVAISGNTAIVGAYRDNDLANSAGSAYLFDTSTGNELFKLTASDPAVGDEFGLSVGISGDTAIIGAHAKDDNGTGSGAAYLFDVATGSELFKLIASDASSADSFGRSVAISGDTAIIGAYRNDDLGSTSGSAYLFDATTGSELTKLVASDGETGDEFGISVAISGSTAIVGARNDNRVGAAYLFDVATGNELFKLTASDGNLGDQFGWSVAIDGNYAIVGAWWDNNPGADTGSAYVFDVTTGSELFKLTPSDAANDDLFGISVAISGTVAVVGSFLDDDDGIESGSAYFFDVTTGNELFKSTASDASAGDIFGRSVAISGTTAIIGAGGDDTVGSDSGSAYLYTTIPEPTTLTLASLSLLAIAYRPRSRRRC